MEKRQSVILSKGRESGSVLKTKEHTETGSLIR